MFCGGAVVIPAPATSPSPAPAPARIVDANPPAQVVAPAPESLALRYVVRVSGGAGERDRLPLVVALHGLGDSPEGFVGLVTEMGLRLRVAAPAGLDRWGDGYAWFASRVGTPHAQWSAGIRRAADAVTPDLARLIAMHPTCGLPVVMGFSQGAMLSYAVVARPGAGVIAALPIGGLLPRDLWPAQRAVGGLLPGVYAFHGAADARVPLADDRATNEAFRAAGFRAELREYPGVPHAIPPEVARDVRQRLVDVMRGQGCPVE